MDRPKIELEIVTYPDTVQEEFTNLLLQHNTGTTWIEKACIRAPRYLLLVGDYEGNPSFMDVHVKGNGYDFVVELERRVLKHYSAYEGPLTEDQIYEIGGRHGRR